MVGVIDFNNLFNMYLDKGLIFGTWFSLIGHILVISHLAKRVEKN